MFVSKYRMIAAAEAQADERGQPRPAFPIRPFQTGSAELGRLTLKIDAVQSLTGQIGIEFNKMAV